VEPDPNQMSWNLSTLDASLATRQYDSVLPWLATAAPPVATPVAVEVWVYTPELADVLLVHHRWRGWVPPGGKLEPGEHPREAARREVLEETGLLVVPDATPAASAVRAFHADWSATLALSYWAVIDRQEPRGEDGQPPEWKKVASDWSTYFPVDARRVQEQADWLSERLGSRRRCR
jgi:8-oxo-dGTP diphosphatase